MPKSRKMWNMKGCASNVKGGKKRKCSCSLWGGRKWKGGSPGVGADFNLAYTGQPLGSLPNNPHLAYTGTGGCGMQKGGMVNGVNSVVPAPLEGTAWSATNWPGQVNDINATQYGLNTYPDPQADRLLFHERDNTVFPMTLYGGKTRSKMTKRKMRNSKRRSHRAPKGKGKGKGNGKNIYGGKRTERKVGGGSGILSQMGADLSNAYNTLQGYPPNPNPLPFTDQYNNPPQDNLAYLKVGNHPM